MNITVNNGNKKLTFPCLLQNVDGNGIILAIGPTTGVVLKANQSAGWFTGRYSDTWVDFSNESQWKTFNGSITLSN